MTDQTLSPWDTAWEPAQQSGYWYYWYGQINLNAWFCTLVKGQGKIPWDPNLVDPVTGQPARRYTCIDLSLAPITDQPINNIERSMLAEFGEWVDITLPSAKEIGLTNLQALNGAWVCCEMAPTGRTYTNSAGETKNATTFKFLRLFENETACRAAHQAARGGNGATETPGVQSQTPAPTTGNSNGSRERETAQKFLKPYVENAWRQSGQDLDKARQALAQMIAGQPLLAKYFTVDSPEALELLAEMATTDIPPF